MKVRMLVAGSRGLAAAAVAALALGIGITALMFAIVDGTVRRGLPVERPSEIVHLDRVAGPGGTERRVFRNDEREGLRQAWALSAIAGYLAPAFTNISADGVTPRRWVGAFVTPNTFETLGARAALGRVFDSGAVTSPGGAPLVISDEVWRQQFGGDPSAVGRAVRANGTPAVIVGVMPPGFRFPFNHHVWMPIDERTISGVMQLWGRLAPGVGRRDAEQRLTAAYAQVAESGGTGAGNARVTVTPFTEFIQTPPIVQLLDMMFLAGLGVLAIACANVANLLLARGLARRRDFAIAGALGASRARIMRERIAEGLALAAPGAMLGIALTYAGAAVFTRAIAASGPPYWVSVVVDLRVLAYAVAVTMLSALAAAAIPSWRSGSAALGSILSDESRGATSGTLRRTTAALVIVEIALATGVLIAAGLMTKGISRLTSARYDFATGDVVTARVTLPGRGYPNADARRTFYETLHARLAAVPGTQSALASSFPFAAEIEVPFALERPDAAAAEWPDVHRVLVSPGYFSTLGVRLIGGRDFEVSDRLDRAPVAIVNLSFALKYARREDLIGRTLRFGKPDSPPVTIVGVAPDLAVGNPRGENPEAVYVALLQQPAPPSGISILTRPARADGSTERQLRSVLTGLDADMPLDRVTTIAAFRETNTWFYRVFGFLFLSFGLGALVLALVGVYAVMSFGVTRRRREIGTRMAFGATRRDIAQLFLVEGALRLAAGLIAGIALAAWLAPRLALFLFRVSPHDAGVYAAAAAIVTAVALSACAMPALRAARLDPNVCLRNE